VRPQEAHPRYRPFPCPFPGWPSHVHPKPMPNWCPQVNPDEAWTARCVKEKIADDAKRHRCQKKVGHDDNVHTCKCGLEWKQW
jgi:hypothetical protein